MSRLAGRLPDLDEATRAEVLQAVRRVADKLLHEPTVRVRELANEEGAVSYAAGFARYFAAHRVQQKWTTAPLTVSVIRRRKLS